jgi:hypothetical protein
LIVYYTILLEIMLLKASYSIVVQLLGENF